MKFLCPTCKAKYQIADEKVAGRSVRMKCRKCGYLISISKAVTDGSTSRSLSSLPPPADATPSPTPPPARTPPPKPTAPKPQPPRAPVGRGSSSELKPPPRGSRPKAVPPPRPSHHEVEPPHRPAPAAAAGMAQVPVAPPRAKSGNGASAHHLFEPQDEYGDEERTVIAGSSSFGALAGAFSEQVASQDASALASSLASTDEWYVGINGVPVGPIRLSELRSKATAGAISVESLVWRDGFEQWLPLGNFPELVAIVEEGLSSARASLTPLSPPAAAAPPVAPRPEVYDPFAQPAAPFGAPSDPYASTLRQPSPAEQVPFAPFGQPAPQPTPLGPTTGTALVTESPRVDEDEVIPIPTHRGTSPMAWVAVGVAMMLGLTIGFVVFNKKPPDPVVQYVQVPATGGPAGQETANPSQPDEPNAEVEADAGEVKVAKSNGKGSTTAVKGTTGGTETGDKPLTGLSGLSGLSGSGPSSGPGSSGTSGGSSGQPLDSASIQKTVGKYTGSVKRSCWQPALDARQKDAPTSARVNVTIVVGPSGSVQSVKTSGDPKGYPGLSSCIASRVRGWQFPPSSGTTTVNVPFVFAAQ